MLLGLGKFQEWGWSTELDGTDFREPGTKALLHVIIPRPLSSWWNGKLAELGNSRESLPVSGLLFSQGKTKELHEMLSEAFSWFPEVLSWEDKAVDKGGGQTVEVKDLSLGEEKKSNSGKWIQPASGLGGSCALHRSGPTTVISKVLLMNWFISRV